MLCDDWQPIATAPCDGRPIILAWTDGAVSVARWMPYEVVGDDRQPYSAPWWWELGVPEEVLQRHGWNRRRYPTHWMAMPPPPTMTAHQIMRDTAAIRRCRRHREDGPPDLTKAQQPGWDDAGRWRDFTGSIDDDPGGVALHLAAFTPPFEARSGIGVFVDHHSRNFILRAAPFVHRSVDGDIDKLIYDARALMWEAIWAASRGRNSDRISLADTDRLLKAVESWRPTAHQRMAIMSALERRRIQRLRPVR
ncbi:hypothetical protein [Azospirillum largimobile]